jgi:hypothetical protein
MATGFTADGQPSRTYSGPGQPGGNAPRSVAFATGQIGDPASAASVSAVNSDADRFNAMVPRQFSQQSVLQTAMPSANGMSANDYQQRMLPGGSMLPTANGSSADTYEKSLVMRLQGREI